MTLLTDAQMTAIRALGEKGMKVTVSIESWSLPSVNDQSNPFGAADGGYGAAVQVQGWLVSVMARDFDTDASRIVGVHDFVLRVPVGTSIKARDRCTIEGTQYTVVETNTEDTWPEWTECHLKKVE